jgi:hypothetical protein
MAGARHVSTCRTVALNARTHHRTTNPPKPPREAAGAGCGSEAERESERKQRTSERVRRIEASFAVSRVWRRTTEL